MHSILGSIVVSIPACHAGDRGSIPRRGGHVIFLHSEGSMANLLYASGSVSLITQNPAIKNFYVDL